MDVVVRCEVSPELRTTEKGDTEADLISSACGEGQLTLWLSAPTFFQCPVLLAVFGFRWQARVAE